MGSQPSPAGPKFVLRRADYIRAESNTAPAWETTRFAVVSTVNDGSEPVGSDIRKGAPDLG